MKSILGFVSLVAVGAISGFLWSIGLRTTNFMMVAFGAVLLLSFFILAYDFLFREPDGRPVTHIKDGNYSLLSIIERSGKYLMIMLGVDARYRKVLTFLSLPKNVVIKKPSNSDENDLSQYDRLGVVTEGGYSKITLSKKPVHPYDTKALSGNNEWSKEALAQAQEAEKKERV